MSISTLTKVCHTNDIPKNEMRCIALAEKNVLVANTSEGIFVADEMCTHEDARLCDGNLSGTYVKCPLHGSRFDLATGKVLDDPANTDLVVYDVSVIDDNIYIR